MSYLSANVMQAAKQVDASKRFGESKVWIHHVHQAFNTRLSLDAFKRMVASDPDCRMFLARADLVQAMDMRDIELSNTRPEGMDDGIVWNFVRLPRGE